MLDVQSQVLEEELHQVAVAGIAHRLVVEVLDLALQRLAQRAEAAGGVERLILDAIERKPSTDGHVRP